MIPSSIARHPDKIQMSRTKPICTAAMILCVLLAPRATQAQDSLSADKERFFENKIRPILIEHCVECHGVDQQEGDLRLDHRDAFVRGGSSGPVFNSSQPQTSRIIRSIEYMDNDLQMPPDGKLPEETIRLLKEWVEQGAFWPADEAPTDNTPVTLTSDQLLEAHRTSHWSYQPLSEPEVPVLLEFPSVDVRSYQKEKPLGMIDGLIGKKLIENGLLANERADKTTLIHRAYFNLIGLPPTYEQVQAFIANDSPDAFEQLIDQLLNDPHYGERWARHWLDIARYGDTTGYIAGSAETRYPYAFTFRDYVIDAFNSDKPYDQFIVEQIAADRLGLEGESSKNLAAMGFLTVGRRFMNRQVDIIDDQIDVISRGFLGLSVACSRCHDHKYDAIPTADYYSLYGVLASSVAPSELPLIGEPVNSPEYQDFLKTKEAKQKEVDDWLEERRVNTEAELQQRIADYLVYLAKSLPQYANGEKVPMQGERGPLRRAAIQRWQQYLTQPQNSPEPIWQLLRTLGTIPVAEFSSTIEKIKTANNDPGLSDDAQFNFVSELPPTIIEQLIASSPATFPDAAMVIGKQLEAVLASWKDAKKNNPSVQALPDPHADALRLNLLSGKTPATLDTAQAVSHLDQGERNRFNQLNNAVNGVSVTHPGAPPRAMVLNDRSNPIEPVIFRRGVQGNRGDQVPRRFLQILEMVDNGKAFEDGSGRLELARAIANEKNPLTARVIVNRIWQHQFGEGIVRSPSDFGIRGETPSHPELLDYLARKFMDEGWSIKKLQKEIMLSNTWQQSSRDRVDAFLKDPENHLVWKMARRRLEFEPLRDRLLAASKQLDQKIGGRSVNIHENAKRRAIYAYIDREDLPGLLANFDLPSPDASRAQRSETTVPQQALFLMNSPFVLSQAEALAGTSVRPAKNDLNLDSMEMRTERIKTLYRNALSRDPNASELSLALEFTDPIQLESFRRAAKENASHHEGPLWNYGYGGWDGKQVKYTPLPFFNGTSWQFSDQFPHQDYQYLHLTAEGGHTGASPLLSPIRRWTAPTEGTYQVNGLLKHPADQGDGVVAQIITTQHGLVKSWKVHQSEQKTQIDEIKLQDGEQVFFIVHLNENTGWDSYQWKTTIDLVQSTSDVPWDGTSSWDSATEFAIASTNQKKKSEPIKELDAWTQLAQALLLSNEFAFVD
jgi:hypothetical protein